MNGDMRAPKKHLGLYYLRLGTGFFTLWSAWDVVVHQQQITTFIGAFPMVGVLAGQILLVWFLVLLVSGGMLLTGWYFREASLVMASLLVLTIVVFSFLTPKINAVLGPFRPLTLKSLVWLGGFLVLLTHPTDPFNPERRNVEGFPGYAGRAHLLFRLILGIYCLWDGLLKAVDANAYSILLNKALAQIPFFPDVLANGAGILFLVVQIVAGLMILSGIRFQWALAALAAMVLVHLIGINWFVTKDLLRPGGRFMLRDICVFTSCAYFWLAGPGTPVLQIKVAGGIPDKTPAAANAGKGQFPPGTK
ncbi:hypothetical protein JW933_09090 [candidate division FCPU426 bacterium]|nr:hypothetical protein [candidate division FCPU426 bacterium]